jgi:hypothetical protein
MRLVLVAFTLAIGLGYLLGGRLSWMSGIRVRWFPLALVGLGMQMAPVPGNRWPVYLLYASFVLLLAFAFMNLKVSGFAIIAVGIILNFTVIAANGGMPVSRQSLVDSGQASTLSDLINAGGAKHHLVGPDDSVTFLADVIAVPPPVSQSVSLGDLFTYGGVVVLIVAAMRRRPEDLTEPVAVSDLSAGSADERT